MSNIRVYKSSDSEKVDELFGGTKRSRDENFAYALDLLDRDLPLADVTSTFASERGGPTYGDEGPGWLTEDAARIMKQAYREAIDVAQRLGLPIDTFWITGAASEFEMQVCQGTDRVTVFVFIPGGEGVPPGSRRARANTWSFTLGESAGRGAAPVIRSQVSGADAPATSA